MSSFAAKRKKKLGLTLMSFGPSSEEADLAASLAAHGELNVDSDRGNIKDVIKEHSGDSIPTTSNHCMNYPTYTDSFNC